MHHMLAICRRKSSQKTIQKEGGKIVWKIVIRMSQQVKPGGKKKPKKQKEDVLCCTYWVQQIAKTHFNKSEGKREK